MSELFAADSDLPFEEIDDTYGLYEDAEPARIVQRRSKAPFRKFRQGTRHYAQRYSLTSPSQSSSNTRATSNHLLAKAGVWNLREHMESVMTPATEECVERSHNQELDILQALAEATLQEQAKRRLV